MRGAVKGCGPRIQRRFPRCLYVWCASHRLNLVIVSSSKVLQITNLMTMADKVSVNLEIMSLVQRQAP